MSTTQTERDTRSATPFSATLEPVPAELAARLANDWVLRTLGVGVSTGSDHEYHLNADHHLLLHWHAPDTDHHLLLHWHAPDIGRDVAIQQFVVCARRADGSRCPAQTAYALLRRATAVLTTRGTWSGLPITRIAEHRGDVESRRFSVLYQIPVGG
jgi:hypothetical protein